MTILTIPASGQFGQMADVTGQELPPNAWTAVQNMRFVNGYSQRVGGHSKVFTTPSVTPYALFSYATPTTRYWVHLGLTSAFADDGTTRTTITPAAPFTGSVDARWTGGTFGGVFVANNGTDVPYYWGGSGLMLAFPGWSATWRAQVITPFKNFLVALDVTKGANRYQHMVKWSQAADPGSMPASWDETNPAIEAGEVDLAETPDQLVDAMPLGDVLVIYKERSMYAMQPSGDSFVFRFSRLPGEYGMLARNCGAVTPKGHVVLTAGDVLLHSGGEPQSILSNKNREWLFRQIDQTNWRRCFVVANPNTSEVWICFPENGKESCTKALIWNWEGDTFGVRDLPDATDAAFGVIVSGGSETWASDTAPWDSDSTAWAQMPFSATKSTLMFSSSAPAIYAMEQTNDFNGSAVSSILERSHLALGGDTDLVKCITGVRPRIDGPLGSVVTIEVGASMDAETSPVYSAPVSYVIGSTIKADTFSAGRFHSFRFSSDGSSPWRMKSFDVEYQPMGRF